MVIMCFSDVILIWKYFCGGVIVRYFNKINLLIELKGEEKEIYGVCNVEIVFWIWY